MKKCSKCGFKPISLGKGYGYITCGCDSPALKNARRVR